MQFGVVVFCVIALVVGLTKVAPWLLRTTGSWAQYWVGGLGVAGVLYFAWAGGAFAGASIDRMLSSYEFLRGLVWFFFFLGAFIGTVRGGRLIGRG